MEIKPEYWTAAAIGKRVNISQRTATKRLNAGELPARRVGRVWVMSEEAWQDYLRSAAKK